MLDSEFTVLHQAMLAEQEWFDSQMYTQDCKFVFIFIFWFKELAGIFFLTINSWSTEKPELI